MVGFTDRMSDYLAASDVLVHSTAGLTVLEALIRGCRVVSFGFKVGHIRVNDRAYQRFGLARTARSREELAQALTEAIAEPRRPDLSYAALPSVATVARTTSRRAEPLASWRLRLTRFATVTAVTVALLAWVLGSDAPYNVLARPLHARPMTSFPVLGPDVGLLVRAPAGRIPRFSQQLHRVGAAASFAIESRPSAATRAQLQRFGNTALPALASGGPVHWVGTKKDLRKTASQFGLDGHFLFAPPQDGFTLGEYLLAHSAGAIPVAGAVQYSGGALGSVAPGQVVEATLTEAANPGPALRSLVLQISSRGLRAVPVETLWRRGGNQARDGG